MTPASSRARRTVVGLALVVAATAGAAAPAGARTLRVGLAVDARQVVIGARGRDVLLATGSAAARAVPGPVLVGVREGGEAPGRAAEPRLIVRARVEPTRRKADLVASALRESVGVPFRVERSGSGFAVLAGPFDSDRRAAQIRDQLHGAGMTDAAVFALEAEPERPAARAGLVAVTGAYDLLALEGGSVRFSAPERGGTVEVDGRPYRGDLEVTAGEDGRLVVVDVVEMEEYLRGVVPEELGPEAFPEPAAIAAQAVAARTYAARTDAHAAQGFALCATQHCQVYGGAASEHAVADAAIAETAGRVLTFDGRPAAAYFSSTCGGHTADVRQIFPGEDDAPYLRGVPCYPEKVGFARVHGRALEPDWALVDGSASGDVLAFAVAAGILLVEEAERGTFLRRVRSDEAAEWTRRAAVAGGVPLADDRLEGFSAETAMDFVRSLAAVLDWQGQRALVAPQDLAAAGRFRELQGLSGDDLTNALLALKAGLLPPGLDPGWPAARLSRGNVVEMLVLWLRRRPGLEPGTARLVSAREGELELLQGKDRLRVRLAPSLVVLSGRRGLPPRLRDAIDVKAGDKLRLLRDGQGAATYLALEEDPDGAAFDRLSPYSWWTRRIPIEDLAQAAEKQLGVRDLRDVRTAEVSASARVVALELVAADGSTRRVEAFPVRALLGVPDLRVDLAYERDARNRLVAVSATGRGWGHGVGLCQYGAFGMALQGRSWTEILAHYYPGTRVQPLED